MAPWQVPLPVQNTSRAGTFATWLQEPPTAAPVGEVK